MVQTLHLFRPLDDKLISLLRSLTPEQWHLYAIRNNWTVKDVASHLLDGNLRGLSTSRDKYHNAPQGFAIDTYRELVSYLNQLNQEWVTATKRLSPEVLTDLLEISGKEYIIHLETLDLDSEAIFPVGWAGEHTSKNWFHIAREYTEKWHHQQQIRDAIGMPAIMNREFYFPVLDTFMQALPYQFKDITNVDDISIEVRIMGEAGGSWFVCKEEQWKLAYTPTCKVDSVVIIPEAIAWKLFCNNFSLEDVRSIIEVEGNDYLAQRVLRMITVMA